MRPDRGLAFIKVIITKYDLPSRCEFMTSHIQEVNKTFWFLEQIMENMDTKYTEYE